MTAFARYRYELVLISGDFNKHKDRPDEPTQPFLFVSLETDRVRLMSSRVGHVLVKDCTNQFLMHYREARKSCVGPQTLKHEINLVRRILKLAEAEWGLDLPQGVPSVRLPRLPSGRQNRCPESALRAITAGMASPYRELTLLAAETGMRRSELVRINQEHIDWSRPQIWVPESNNGRARTVPLSTAASVALRGYLSTASHSQVKPDSLSQSFSCAAKRAGYPDIRFHDLRHEAISRFFELGYNVPQVAAISGHRDFRMLARYAHADDQWNLNTCNALL